MILGVIAENGLPFSMGQVIIDTAKELIKDPHALDKVALSRTAASYKMRFGLEKTYSENLPFSLNMDESFSNNHKRCSQFC